MKTPLSPFKTAIAAASIALLATSSAFATQPLFTTGSNAGSAGTLTVDATPGAVNGASTEVTFFSTGDCTAAPIQPLAAIAGAGATWESRAYNINASALWNICQQQLSDCNTSNPGSVRLRPLKTNGTDPALTQQTGGGIQADCYAISCSGTQCIGSTPKTASTDP